jgi:hypothetical protein
MHWETKKFMWLPLLQRSGRGPQYLRCLPACATSTCHCPTCLPYIFKTTFDTGMALICFTRKEKKSERWSHLPGKSRTGFHPRKSGSRAVIWTTVLDCLCHSWLFFSGLFPSHVYCEVRVYVCFMLPYIVTDRVPRSSTMVCRLK